MSITTKTGDRGKTALFGGKRVSKDNIAVEAYGALDEATSFIGFAHVVVNKNDKEILTKIQKTLYLIMAYLSGADFKKDELAQEILFVENSIKSEEHKLSKLTRFILPQGSEETSRLHIARVIIRSSERRVVSFLTQKKPKQKGDKLILQYLNRLSDLFFLLARKYSSHEKVV